MNEKIQWLDENSILINIKLNDLCNTNCLHCVSHGKEKSKMPIDSISNLYYVIEFLISKNIKNLYFSFVGGELTLLPEAYLKTFFIEFSNMIQSLYEKNLDISVDVMLISNFIIHEKKRDNYFDLFTFFINLSKNSITYRISTSFDIGLKRFKSNIIENSWFNNCTYFIEDLKQNLSLHVTLNSQTCENIDNILNNLFFHKFNEILIQSLKSFNGIKNDIIPDYETLKNCLTKIRQSPIYKDKIKLDYPKIAYSINLNQDNIMSVNYSEYASFYESEPFLYFNINKFNEIKEDFFNSLINFKQQRIKQTLNKNCILCPNFKSCDFGIENFSYKCPKFII